MSALFEKNWGFETLTSFEKISPLVQLHLKQVYLTLCCALVASAVGVYMHLLWNIGGILTALGFIGSIVWLSSIPPWQEQRSRVFLLMAAAFFNGAAIGPLLELVLTIDPGIIITAFVGTAVAFACFSAVAILSQRREYLYLGGLLSSGLSILIWLHFASTIFGGSTALFEFELYLGLLLFAGYVLVDTQAIIELASFGDLDYVKHALTLFTDFAAILVRIVIVLLKNTSDKEEEEEEEEEEERRRRG